ncbi:MAG: hypothetical protein AAF497_04875, partial [Planctomycetota bacterium]
MDVSGTMTMVYMGTIGSVSGRLVLESRDTSDPLATPDIWGVLKVESGLDKLAEAGIDLNAEALLRFNTSDVEKVEVLRLIGIVGDELATVNGGAALTTLDGLSPILPPFPLDTLPGTVKSLIEATLGVSLSASTTVEVIVTGAKWKARDEDNDVTYFLEEVSGSRIRISSEFQTFMLTPETYLLELRGELIFRFPAFESDGITPGPDLFVISGGATLKINRDGLEGIAVGRAKVGPTGGELLEFDAQGVLILNDSGIAAGMSMLLNQDNVPGIDFNGSFTMVLNTMDGLQQVAVPTLFRDELLPTPPTISGQAPGELIPDAGDNATLFWQVNPDGTTLTPVLVVPGEAPDLNGNFDPNANNTPFLVITGSASLVVNPAGVNLFTLTGQFQITAEPTQLRIAAAFGTSNPVLGSLTGTAALTFDADGMYGVAQVTRDIGSPVIPAVELNLNFLIEFNTSAVTKTIQRLEVNRTTGAIATTPVNAALEAFQVRIVGGGEFIVRSGSTEIVRMTGRFEFVTSEGNLAISVAARLALGDGSITADVEGAALLRVDGFAIQIMAATDASATESVAGAGFRLELGGSALIRINTTNTFISHIASVEVNLNAASGATPFFEVRMEGAGRIEFFIDGIGGLKIEGEVATQIGSGGVIITVNGELTANLAGVPLVRMNASGSFEVFTGGLIASLAEIRPDHGIAGRIALQVGATTLLGGVGFNLEGTFVLEVNTMANFVSHANGVAVNLAAGPYARIKMIGVIRFSLGGAASFELYGSGAGQGFEIQMNATRVAIIADANLLAKVGGTTLLNMTVTDGLLAIGLNGIIANINLDGGLSGPGYSFSGTYTFKLNTTGQNAFISNGVVTPGIQVQIIGDLNAGGFRMNGQFAIELNNNGFIVGANADLIYGSLVRLELIDSFLQITNRGIAARVSVGGTLGGSNFQFRSSTVISFLLNTTGRAVTRVNGSNVGLRAGYYAEIHMVGDLSLLNIITARGTFVATAASGGLSVRMDAHLSVMDIGFRVQATAHFASDGVAFKSRINLAAGGSTIKPINGISISGNFELQVNTKGYSYAGMGARSIRVAVSGGINVAGFTMFNINFSIGIRADGFDAAFSGTIDLSVVRVGVSGTFNSNGNFSVTGTTSINLSAGPAYLSVTGRLTIDNSGFRMRLDGSAGLKIAGIRVGVGIGADAFVSGSELRIRAEACVTIDYLIGSKTFCAGHTFTVGRVPASHPGNASTSPAASVGFVSGGSLSLDMNRFGGTHGRNLISIISEGASIRVSGNGYSQVFSGVSNISLNLGNGNDYFYVGSGVAANVIIDGGNGHDEIVYLGSGTATIRGGAGNDEIRVVNDRNFRPAPAADGLNVPLSNPLGYTLIGGSGDDIIIGGNGNDHIEGNGGHDRLDGGGGDDTIHGGSENDIIYGGTGNDKLFGDGGNDIIYGEQNNDELDGGHGDDILLGGSGNEKITWTSGTGNDVEINGQSGYDEITFLGTGGANNITASQGDNNAIVITNA